MFNPRYYYLLTAPFFLLFFFIFFFIYFPSENKNYFIIHNKIIYKKKKIEKAKERRDGVIVKMIDFYLLTNLGMTISPSLVLFPRQGQDRSTINRIRLEHAVCYGGLKFSFPPPPCPPPREGGKRVGIVSLNMLLEEDDTIQLAECVLLTH